MMPTTTSGSRRKPRTVIAICAGLLMTFNSTSRAGETHSDFVLLSPVLKEGAMLPAKHVGCYGISQNISPALSWTAGPEGTGSYAVAVYQRLNSAGRKGAPSWLVYNIPHNVRSLGEGAGSADAGLLPAGASQVQLNNRGWFDYHGPCPEPGQVGQYVFAVYAIKTPKLDAGERRAREVLEDLIEPDQLAVATIKTTYGR